ncbi:hypothetical protein ACFO1S_04765 [Cohnella boryungensis]|uniref:Uncharacterized protein n=1 Tax=Cohnella boryungensis TaxID=768479 RepID=A0ABV8S8D7_9BACL
MVAKTDENIHLEAVEEAENDGAKLAQAGSAGVAGLPMGKQKAWILADAGSAILQRSVTNEKLAQARYYDFSAQYDALKRVEPPYTER